MESQGGVAVSITLKKGGCCVYEMSCLKKNSSINRGRSWGSGGLGNHKTKKKHTPVPVPVQLKLLKRVLTKVLGGKVCSY